MADSFHQIRKDSVPKFLGENFSLWKKKIKSFILSVDPDIWLVITGEPNSFSYERWMVLNARGLMIFYHALDDFKSFLNFSTAKETWDIFEHVFEENILDKNTKLNGYLFQLGLFKMSENELIIEMASRFHEIIHNLKNLGKTFSDSFLVRKFIVSLSDDWKVELMSMGDEINSSLSNLTDLVSFLRFKEGVIKLREEKARSNEEIRLEEYFSFSEIENVFEKLHIKDDLAKDFRNCLLGKSSNSGECSEIKKFPNPFSEEEMTEAMYTPDEIEEILSSLKKVRIERRDPSDHDMI